VGRFQAKQTRPDSDPAYICRTVRWGEKRYLDSEVAQRNGEIVNDSLGPAVIFGWHGKYCRSNLGDSDIFSMGRRWICLHEPLL
jgi:hypothetical protein